MPDRVRLAADVFLPSASGRPVEGRRPTILIFTPYYRRFAVVPGADSSAVEVSPNTARYRDLFTPAGYNVVVVDVRGTGASFGHREGFRSPTERNDYCEVAEWVCRQVWSDGRVGVTGISYLGAASDFLASTGHPAVKAIAPLFSVWDTYENNYFPGGVQLFDLIESYSQLMIGLDQDDREAIRPYASYAHPAFDGPAPVDADTGEEDRDAAVLEHRGNYRHADMMREFVMRERPLSYDPDYSSASFSPYSYSDGIRPDVAIYSVSGWMDGAGYANGAISRFLTKNRNPHHLLLGPWDHGARSHVSPWSDTGAPDESWWFEILRFFDEYLSGQDTGIRDEAAIHFYALHAEEWRSSPSWPLASSSTRYELASDGRLRPQSTIGAAGEAATQSNSRAPQSTPDGDLVGFIVDFGAGTGRNTRYERIAGKLVSRYYSDWQGRTDHHLAFETPVLNTDLELTGHAIATLHLSSNQPDGTVFVYLTEVESDGTERYVTEGLLRLMHRFESDNPSTVETDWPYRSFKERDARPMIPDKQETVRLPLLPTAWSFSSGSTVRLSIAGADADHATQSPHGRPPRLVLGINGPSTIEFPTR
nr:CocE/NonD family hydrolase [Brevibacterium marinum]